MERPKTIGVFAGIYNREGKILLQRRTEKRSIIPGKSYKGDWELPGGRIKEKDVKKALNLEVLARELSREVKEEVGIESIVRANPSIYLAIFVNEEKGINDWAFMLPTAGEYDIRKAKREIIWVDPDELREIANQPKEEGQLVSGWGKRMCRMSLGALYNSFNLLYREKAEQYLNEIKSDWHQAEYADNANEFLKKLKEGIG